ncbi:hypothetical protein GCM10027168_00700 [Streptomyces capparidis]|jgi:hypothetical protein
MADNDYDPAGSTQMFRAFVDEGANAPAQAANERSRTGLIVLMAVITAVVVAAVLWLALG